MSNGEMGPSRQWRTKETRLFTAEIRRTENGDYRWGGRRIEPDQITSRKMRKALGLPELGIAVDWPIEIRDENLVMAE